MKCGRGFPISHRRCGGRGHLAWHDWCVWGDYAWGVCIQISGVTGPSRRGAVNSLSGQVVGAVVFALLGFILGLDPTKVPAQGYPEGIRASAILVQ